MFTLTFQIFLCPHCRVNNGTTEEDREKKHKNVLKSKERLRDYFLCLSRLAIHLEKTS